MAFVDRIRECNAHDRSRFVPWRIDGATVGHVRRDRVGPLLAAPGGIRRAGDGLELDGDGFDDRSARLRATMDAVAAAGDAPAARGELYPVARSVRGAPRCVVDRAHVAWLGVSSAGVHVNGFVRTPHGLDMWIAVRARDRPTFPGQLDNMVAGGQPHGLGLCANVVKECGEEAGIAPDLARRAVAVGAVSYVFEDDTGLKPDTMFCFDLELADDFVPVCTDGEVERFERLPLEAIADLVADSRRFKFNCNLVVIDFLVRHGIVDADDPDYVEIVHGLRRPLVR